MKLVIAEKPSVARSIAAVIGATQKQNGYMEGNGYLVSWCIGHLVSFADAGRYDERFKKWRHEDLPIIPEPWQYIIPDDKKQQFETIRELANRPDVERLVCATDAGREGELIFRFVYQMADCNKPFSRLWISSMEDSAIREGFQHLKPGADYDALYQSALCRSKADWLIGINATRLFSVLYHRTLTVGRVQTPTLKMLADRDEAITHFQKEKYHIVHISAGGAEAVSSRVPDAAEADTIKTACAGAQAVCASMTREKKTEQPPKLFDLTTLQREANRLFGFTAKQTLDYAQALYEKRLLTYPRTDSRFLTDDMEQTAADTITGLLPLLPFMEGVELTPEIRPVLNSAKVSDHHAIIPTAEFIKQGFDGLTESEKKLLSLIACKLLCAVAAPHVYEAVTAAFTCAGNEFTAKGRTVLCGGWKEVERRFRAFLKADADGDDAEPDKELPELSDLWKCGRFRDRAFHSTAENLHGGHAFIGYGAGRSRGHAGRRRTERIGDACHPRRHLRKAGADGLCREKGQAAHSHQGRPQPCKRPAGRADFPDPDRRMGKQADGDCQGGSRPGRVHAPD